MLVVFSHGKETGPRGRKIQALTKIAHDAGAQTMSIDYREYPAGVYHDHDAPDEANRRIRQLLSTQLPEHDKLILVGSSMGGNVSAVAASMMHVDGLFLLAPALTMPGYVQVEPKINAQHTSIVHGWRDEVIPWQHSAEWASKTHCTLQLVDSDHGLDSALHIIESTFRQFIKTCGA